jgi:hypothetical protein
MQSFDQFPQELHAGWLVKQGALHKNWKKRWFVVRGGHMLYYSSPSVRDVYAMICACLGLRSLNFGCNSPVKP